MVGKNGSGTLTNNCHFNNVKNTKPTTPLLPTRLSFIISNLRSRSRPENKPSQVSINPSAWSPPVKRNSKITSNNINKDTGIYGCTNAYIPHIKAPMTNPTNGKYVTEAPKSSTFHSV